MVTHIKIISVEHAQTKCLYAVLLNANNIRLLTNVTPHYLLDTLVVYNADRIGRHYQEFFICNKCKLYEKDLFTQYKSCT